MFVNVAHEAQYANGDTPNPARPMALTPRRFSWPHHRTLLPFIMAYTVVSAYHTYYPSSLTVRPVRVAACFKLTSPRTLQLVIEQYDFLPFPWHVVSTLFPSLIQSHYFSYFCRSQE